MRSTKKWLGLFVITCAIALYSGLFAAEVATAPKTEPATPAEAKSIDATAAYESNHPAIEPGLACNDCHEIKLDANTTATQLWLSGEWGQKKRAKASCPRSRYGRKS